MIAAAEAHRLVVIRQSIADAIREERVRQDEMLGGQPGIDRLHAQLEIFAVLGEEVGEVAKAILEDDYEGLRTELVQVAAVAVAFLEEMGLREMPR